MSANISKKKSVVLELENLSLTLKTDEGPMLIIDEVNIKILRGQTVGLVGESGAGKSMLARSLMQLLPENAVFSEKSKILYHPDFDTTIDIAKLPNRGKKIEKIRGKEIAMIFQQSMSAFSPLYKVGEQIVESIRVHADISYKEAKQKTIELLETLHIADAEKCFDQYIFQLSGGMRQRVMIASALILNPKLLISDEATTALDVTTQAQVVALMMEMQLKLQTSIIFISHDLAITAQIADEIVVMYKGQIFEKGLSSEILENPQHPYTQLLINAIPDIKKRKEKLIPIPGDINGDSQKKIKGCAFFSRCKKRIENLCEHQKPKLEEKKKRHFVSCHL